MTIPGFTAEAALGAEPSTQVYAAWAGAWSHAGIKPQASLRAGRTIRNAWVARCLVNCISRSGGTDPVAQIENCAWICEKMPFVVF